MRKYSVVLGCLLVSTFAPYSQSAEVFEVGEDRFSEMPKGKEADGIVGDFVIRNDKVEAVISGSLPLRRANMSTFYGSGNETPGCLFDLTRRGEANDQITIFAPCTQKGPVNYVKILDVEQKNRVVLETFVSAAKSGGISRRHLYILEDGWEGVLIVSTIRNESKKEVPVSLNDVWTQMRSKGIYKGISWADSIDPADKCGYAFAWVEEEGAQIPKAAEAKMRPDESITVARFLAVGRSPAEAVGIVASRKDSDSTGKLSVQLKDENGGGVASGRLVFTLENQKPLYAYPDEKGLVEINHIVGDHSFKAEDMGRTSVPVSVSISSEKPVRQDVAFGTQAAVKLSITDSAGNDTPCKVQFNPLKGTAPPTLGPTDRAHGCVDQWHSETGDFTVPIPPGNYRVVVTRGPEHDHIQQDVEVGPGIVVEVAGKLKRSVQTPGWISTDFHDHSTPSGDNTCGTDDRIINLAVEQVEFAPTTEHNRLYDWEPHIKKLGLSAFIKTVPGMELTGGGAHFNTFPLKPEPMKQDGGAPVWQKDPRLNAIVLRNYQNEEPDRWVHVNHPDMSENFVDWNGDGQADGGYAYFGKLLDGLETQNFRQSDILAGAPFSIGTARGGIGKQVNYHREFIWLQLLNRGMRVWGIGVNDAHHIHGNGVGGWRTYVKSSTDVPAEIDWREISRNAKAGRMIVTSGPYLEVSTGAGIIAGGSDRATASLDLNVKVQCASWLDIDRVQVLVNGAQVPEYNFTRKKNPEMFGDEVVKFDQKLKLKLSKDAHIIVVAVGENHSLHTGFGTSKQGTMQPCAYNNPIFVDVDGGGFTPSFDSIGYDLPAKRLSVERVEALLGK